MQPKPQSSSPYLVSSYRAGVGGPAAPAADAAPPRDFGLGTMTTTWPTGAEGTGVTDSSWVEALAALASDRPSADRFTLPPLPPPLHLRIASALIGAAVVVSAAAVAAPLARMARAELTPSVFAAAPVTAARPLAASPGRPGAAPTDRAVAAYPRTAPATPAVPSVDVADLPRAFPKGPKADGVGAKVSVGHRDPAAPGTKAPEEDGEGDAPTAPKRGGALTVVCYPACDDVRVDDRSVGPSPVFKHAVTAGAHRVKLRAYDPDTTKVIDVSVQGETPVVLRQSMEH